MLETWALDQKHPSLVIYRICIFFIIILIKGWWTSRQIINNICLLSTPAYMLQYQPQLCSHLCNLLMYILCGLVNCSSNYEFISLSIRLPSAPSFVVIGDFVYFCNLLKGTISIRTPRNSVEHPLTVVILS